MQITATTTPQKLPISRHGIYEVMNYAGTQNVFWARTQDGCAPGKSAVLLSGVGANTRLNTDAGPIYVCVASGTADVRFELVSRSS